MFANFTKDRVRVFVALIAAVLFLFLQAVFPGLPFTEEQVVLFFGLVAAYILGEGLEGPRIRDNIGAVLRSHKFQAAIAGIVLLCIQAYYPAFPLDAAALEKIIGLLSVLILGAGAQGFAEQLQRKPIG